MNDVQLFTVGHSNHSFADFARLLSAHRISCVVDVRSVPSSRMFAQFNKNLLADGLKQNQIKYLFFGLEFGARRSEPFLLDEKGVVDFEKVQQTIEFQRAATRIFKGLALDFNIALMCAEANPLECHRFGMVARYFAEKNVPLAHILNDCTTRTHFELEDELLAAYQNRFAAPQLFDGAMSRAEKLRRVYQWRNQEIGFLPKL